jgi:dephospho-CoA kinase
MGYRVQGYTRERKSPSIPFYKGGSKESGPVKCFIIIGMPAAGKDIARQVARAKGYPYFATGDIVRAEAARRGVSPDADSMAKLSTELRGNDGLGVTRLALKTAVHSGEPVVFMEGIRSKQEIDLIGAQSETVVVAFLAPRSIRKARVLSRGRPDDSAAAFDGRDRREIDYGLAVPIALADEYILNTGTVGEALDAFGEIIDRHAAE